MKNQNLSDEERIKQCENFIATLDKSPLKCKINENNKLIIYGNIVIQNCFAESPIKIDEVYGDVYIDNAIDQSVGSLTSLNNMPTIVYGDFNISNNPKLESLVGGPLIVKGNYICERCNLKDFSGIANYIGKRLIANHNNIKSLRPLLDITIGGGLDIVDNPAYNSDEIIKYRHYAL